MISLNESAYEWCKILPSQEIINVKMKVSLTVYETTNDSLKESAYG